MMNICIHLFIYLFTLLNANTKNGDQLLVTIPRELYRSVLFHQTGHNIFFCSIMFNVNKRYPSKMFSTHYPAVNEKSVIYWRTILTAY